MATSSTCPVGSDNSFGPRVNTNCRNFDFTLLFEDAICIVLPAAVLLLLMPARWRGLQSASRKSASYTLALLKLALLATLFFLQIAYLAEQLQVPQLQTKASLAASILTIVATLSATWTSFLEDQRSIEPSYHLVLYFSAATLLSLPRLRSLWILKSSAGINACRGLWTTIVAFTVLIVLVECMRKGRWLRSTPHVVTKEQLSSFWDRSFFIWLLPLLKAGSAEVLKTRDLPSVDADLTGEVAGRRLQEDFKKNPLSKYRLLKATFTAYGGTWFWTIPPRLAQTAFAFSQPFLITTVVNYMDETPSSTNTDYGPSLVGAYVLMYIGLAVSAAVYKRQVVRTQSMVRAGLVSMIYQQTVKLNTEMLKDAAAVTLMNTDVSTIIANLANFHELWASLFEIVLAVYLLQRQIGVVCVVPIVISLGCVFAMGPISSRLGSARKAWIERVQKRIAITSSMLSDMRAVQMLGLSDALSVIITNLRKIEVDTSGRYRTLLVWVVGISNTQVVSAPFATLAVYSIVALVKKDKTLLAAEAFTSIALVTLLSNPLLMFLQSMPSVPSATASLGRIQVFLEIKTDKNESETPASVESGIEMQRGFSGRSKDSLVSFSGARVSRSADAAFELKRLDLEILPGLTVIIGPVGSGKSTLIEAIVNPDIVQSGSINTAFSRAAYCPQVPWVMNASIRENIIGVSDFDEKWYHEVISICGLEDNFKDLPGWDLRLTGSKGVALSGGQKQRLALARAVYSKLEVLILDSPFSGLDANTLANITRRLFGPDGHLKKTGKSVILVTNSYQLLPYADEVVLLDAGTIAARGSYEDVSTSMAAFFSKLQPEESAIGQAAEEETLKLENDEVAQRQDETADGESDSVRRNGSWTVYSYYLRSGGWIFVAIFGLCFMIESISVNGMTLWLQWWVEADAAEPNQHLGLYLGVYAALFLAGACGLVIGCGLLFVPIMANISLKMHADLLAATLRAPVSFYQRTDTGSLTNRFSQDMELIDMDIGLQLVNFVEGIFNVAVKLIMLCVLGKYLAATLPCLILAIYFVQSFYLRTSRQIRLLDIEAKAPLYTNFLETIDGIACIRVFGWAPQFREKAEQKLDVSQKPAYLLYCIQQWLRLVLDLLTGAIAVILISIMTSMRDEFSGASVGVVLNLLLSFGQTLIRTIQSWTTMETSIGSVQRIQTFVENTPREEEDMMVSRMTGNDWPVKGTVSFQRVTASYSTSPNPILKGLSFDIQAGEKIAVCGASGSGKTSLIMAVLRMLDNCQGRILIDGRDTTTVHRSDLRSAINVIPQEPFLMPGTVRFNMDPQELCEDSQIEATLKKVGLWDRISENGGLEMALSSSDWSVGQRQLFELARALLAKSSLLILDEANSNMDWETEATMQKIIETEFADRTVIAVVHRLRFIERFDKVALLSQGELVEFENPTKLLQQESEFKKLYTALQHS